MPYKRKSYRRRPARRTTRRRTTRRTMVPRMPINKGPKRVGFPKLMTAKLSYNDVNIQNSSTASVVFAQYRVNGLYDPRWDVGGSQPYYFDQVCSTAGIYSAYRVMGMSYRISAEVITAGQCCYIWWGTTPSSVDVTVAPAIQMNANPNFKRRSMVQGQNLILIKGYTSGYRAAGLTKAQYNVSETTSAGGGADPVNQPRLAIGTINTDMLTSTTVRLTIELVYYCQFFEIRQPLFA